MNISSLATPALVLDHNRFLANIDRVRRCALGHPGLSLRPHLKTAKSIDAAREILRHDAKKITVSTLREARYFVENGVRDILYAVSIVPEKLDVVASLLATGAKICVVVDDIEVASAISRRGFDEMNPLGVMIEIDSDGHRAGLCSSSDAILEIAAQLNAARGVDFAGVMTHAGESYNCSSPSEIARMAEQERLAAVTAAERIRAAGMPCREVSIGSTPTYLFSENLAGVTEARMGVAFFFDLTMAGLGVCVIDEIAISVLATVIGHQRGRKRLLIDAGWMALSVDRSEASQRIFNGLGIVADIDGKLIDGMGVLSANQEHGIVGFADGAAPEFDRFPIGAKLRIFPNHACATAASFQHYNVMIDGGEVIAGWPRCSGW